MVTKAFKEPPASPPPPQLLSVAYSYCKSFVLIQILYAFRRVCKVVKRGC
jgi:hypothetical protein